MAKIRKDDKKTTDDRSSDEKILKDEMVEGKNPNEVAAIYREGGKYYCAECRTELPMHQSCPTCHAHVDWDRFISESRAL
jgi:rubrerythrin